MKCWSFKLLKFLIGAYSLFGAYAAFAQTPSHAYINSMRSSSTSHYIVTIGVDGEFGRVTTQEMAGKEKVEKDSRWQGYGIRNELGVEFLKFLTFSLGHTSLNLRNSSDATENLSGSRLHGGVMLSFYSPLGNVGIGTGALASRLDYRDGAKSAGYYGTGYYYVADYNYFLTQSVSFFMAGKQLYENHVRNSGNEDLGTIKVKDSTLGLGFRIWM